MRRESGTVKATKLEGRTTEFTVYRVGVWKTIVTDRCPEKTIALVSPTVMVCRQVIATKDEMASLFGDDDWRIAGIAMLPELHAFLQDEGIFDKLKPRSREVSFVDEESSHND